MLLGLFVAGTSEIFSLDIETMTWTLESTKIFKSEDPFAMLKLRFGGGAAAIGDRLYLFGGSWSLGVLLSLSFIAIWWAYLLNFNCKLLH